MDLDTRVAAIERQHESIAEIVELVPWLKGLIVGAFALGVWCTTLTLNLSQAQSQIAEIQSERRAVLQNWNGWREEVSQDLARTQADVSWIRRQIEKGGPR